jgi:hypothetical protein
MHELSLPADLVTRVTDRAGRAHPFDVIEPGKTAFVVAKATRYERPDPGARGLYVVVQPSGTKSFAVRYRTQAGQPRKLTLTSGITLSAARKLAADAMHEVASGRDPAVTKADNKARARAKVAAAAVNTLQAICENYLKREGGGLRTADARKALLQRAVYPSLGSRQVDTVRRSELVRLLDKN